MLKTDFKTYRKTKIAALIFLAVALLPLTIAASIWWLAYKSIDTMIDEYEKQNAKNSQDK